MMSSKILAACLGLLIVSPLALALADDMKDMPGMAPATQPTAAAAPSTQPFNKLCPITHEEVDPSVQTVTVDGKVVGFCCKDCVEKFKADPQKYMKDLR